MRSLTSLRRWIYSLWWLVWPHHVGLITDVHADGTATVISGNDGNRVRERVLSLRGAVAYRVPG